jgi:FkbM family methyltransferase
VDYSLALALRNRGHTVAMVACGGLPAYCERENNQQQRPPCEDCLHSITLDFQKYQLPFYRVKDFISATDLEVANRISSELSVEALKLWQMDGIPVGNLAWLNLFQFFKGYPFHLTGERESVFRRCAHSGILMTAAARKIILDYQPDVIVTVNGKFIQWAPYVHLARQLKIRYVTWEDIGVVKNGTIFAADEIAHSQKIDSVWSIEARRPLTDEDRREVRQHFKMWAEGTITTFAYYDQTSNHQAENVRSTLGLRPDSPVVALFPNVSWDSTSIGFESAFTSMYDWAFRVVDYARRRPDLDFVIRAHPAEKKVPEIYKSTTPICDEVRTRFPDLPPNVKLVDATHPLSSYAVAQISSVLMVYTSTMGIEFALKGWRPWVAANAYYAGKGFTLDLTSSAQMEQSLNLGAFDKSLTAEHVALAERFAHLVRFRRIFPFPFIDGAAGTFTPPSLDVFQEGAHPVLDNLCDYVLSGQPFLDLGWRELVADEALANVKSAAAHGRFGFWKIKLRGQTVYCRDLLSFYMAAKDIFLHRIYDFKTQRSQPVLIDGGGHIGLFTLFAKAQYPGAHVTVFEPDPEALRLLRYNLAVNRLDQVTVVPAGLYKQSGHISFGADHSDGGSIYATGKTHTIPVVRLSDYISGPVDFLKLNIEGAELDVLREAEAALSHVDQLVLEYHGFPELCQPLHEILALLDRAGFRYLLHDFDAQTNPATKPPFHLEKEDRFFLLIYARRLFPARAAHSAPATPALEFQRLEPVSRHFGFDRGNPIDRFYIEAFLEKQRPWIRGRVLEIGGNDYTRQFGVSVTRSDVLNAVSSPVATIVGDLATGQNIPEAAFDCIILTQTLQVIFDIKAVLRHAARALKPGGVLLLTASGISQISRYDMDRWGEFWRFTDLCLKRLLGEAFPADAIHVKAHGNVAVAKAFLDGLAQQDLPAEILSQDDPDYQVVLTAMARRPGPSSALPAAPADHVAPAPAALPTPLVLLYHRVTHLPVDSQLLAVTPENFAAQLQHLAGKYRVVALHNLLEEFRRNQYRSDTVALTFDDGYLDVLLEAVPLLEKYRIPATVFVTSGRVGSDCEFWWDALERVFLTNTALPQALSVNNEGKDRFWDLTTPDGRLKACDDLAAVLRVKVPEEIEAFIEALFKWARLANEGRITHRVVTADQLRQLARSPVIEIGSHTVSHARLSSLPPDCQRRELAESKRQLEAVLQRPIRLFSYPFGSVDDFSAETMKLVVSAGYEAAVANTQGVVTPPANLLAVPRRLVRNWNGKEFSNWLQDSDMDRLPAETLSTRAATITAGLGLVIQHRRD